METNKKEKTIIHFKPSAFLHLSENWIYDQIKNLENFKPIVYTGKIIHQETFPVKTIRDFSKNNLNWILKVTNILSKKIFNLNILILKALLYDKPHIIHAHFGIHGYHFLPYKKITKVPLITTFYGYDLSQLPNTEPIWKKRYKKLFKEGNGFLVEGEHMKKTLNKLGCPEKKIHVYHLGIDVENIKFKKRILENDDTVKILIAGRFVEKKGISQALNAIKKFIQEFPDQKIFITIIGDGDKNCEEKKNILNILKSKELKKINKIFKFLPHSSFLQKLYEHHIFISPSVTSKDGDTEGGVPVSIITATASGMPVISSFHCDIPSVILDKKNGLLAKERDTSSLSVLLKNMINSKDSWEEMGLFGHHHIKKHYNNKIQIKKLEKIYDLVLNQKN